jgi:hypothetical protein
MANYRASQKDAKRLHAHEATFVQTHEGRVTVGTISCLAGSAPRRLA